MVKELAPDLKSSKNKNKKRERGLNPSSLAGSLKGVGNYPADDGPRLQVVDCHRGGESSPRCPWNTIQ